MILGSGAEAYVEKTDDGVRKVRPSKGYRHPELDRRLLRFRTRREAKVLKKLPVAGPSLLAVDDKEMVITMEFLDGPQVRDVLSQANAQSLGEEIGRLVRGLHDAGIVHGDLTTSNMLLVQGTVHLIDFGLAQFSDDIEDKAVDLHLLMHALAAKHPDLPVWEHVRKGYGRDDDVWERFEEVELRGRYKQKQ